MSSSSSSFLIDELDAALIECGPLLSEEITALKERPISKPQDPLTLSFERGI